MNGLLFPWEGNWRSVPRNDPSARALADRHYSRQSPGARDFMGSGELLVLLSICGRAVWGTICNRDMAGALRWRVSIFRNEGAGLSSALIIEATTLTRSYWRRHYGGEPAVRLTTEVDAKRVRRKRDPGRCFLRAGWEYIETLNPKAEHGRPALLQFGAPLPVEGAPPPAQSAWGTGW